MGGVVVAPQPPAAEVGAEILRAGGNAFDAGVAAVFMQAAADPFMCGIGGFGIGQVFVAETATSRCVQFYGRAGRAVREDMWADRVRKADDGKTYVEGWSNEIGYGSIGIPGTVAGMMEIHRRWGRMPWAELLRPAERFLRDGYPLYRYIADYFSYPAGPPTKPTQLQRFSASPEMARIWLREDGQFLQVGETVQLTDYADTVSRLAEAGGEDFYRGDIADVMTDDWAANGASISRMDLASYRAVLSAPLTGKYRDYEVRVPSLPGGGVTLLQMLNVLDQFDLASLKHNSPEYLELLIGAMQAAAGQRREHLGDPAFVDVPLDELLSPGWAIQTAEEIRSGRQFSGEKEPADSTTTHLTVCDDEGDALAVTHTLGMGSGVITPGLGFQYNNCLGGFDPEPGRPNSPAPGKARISSMSPAILVRDGRPQIVLGSPGSNAIVNAILQTLCNTIDFGMEPLQAVSQPRVHCEGQPVSLESRILRSTASTLAGLGYRVEHGAIGYDTLQGRVQLAVATPACSDAVLWRGASDPRRDGGIAVHV
ncbi:MAG: gamma-glutamyltransferase [Bacillota bacterium]